jgi:hypothetical protein
VLGRRTGLVVLSLAALAVDGFLGAAHEFEPTRKMRAEPSGRTGGSDMRRPRGGPLTNP